MAINGSDAGWLLDSVHRVQTGFARRGRRRPGKFRVVGGVPRPSGKLQGFALPIAPHIAPKDSDNIGRPRFVLSSGQPV